MAAQALVFHDTTFNPVIRNNQPWLTAAEIGKALGYSDDKSISRIYRRNASEFTPSMTAVVEGVNLTTSRESSTYSNLQKKVRIFSLRGAHLIGMFARTKLAAELRRWVLDILDQYTAQLPRDAEETLLPSEQQTLSKIVHKRAEGYGDLQSKVLAEIWSRVHNKFRVARYSQLTRTQLSEAILYVTGMEIKAGKPKAEVPISHAQYHELRRLVYLIGNCFHYRNAAQWAAWATLREKLFAEPAAKIPASRYGQASAILNDIQEAASAFKSAVMELETGFFERHFSAILLEIKELERGYAKRRKKRSSNPARLKLRQKDNTAQGRARNRINKGMLENVEKILLEKIPETLEVSFVPSVARLSFDNHIHVPLDLKRLVELRDYCDRAIKIIDETRIKN